MKTLILLLSMLAVVAAPAPDPGREMVEVQVLWSTEGLDDRVVGFRIHYGLLGSPFDTVIDVGMPPIRDDDDGIPAYYPDRFPLPTGTKYHLALTVYDAQGLESDPGPEIKFITAPGTPLRYQKES